MYGKFHAVSDGHLELRVGALLVTENEPTVCQDFIGSQI